MENAILRSKSHSSGIEARQPNLIHPVEKCVLTDCHRLNANFIRRVLFRNQLLSSVQTVVEFPDDCNRRFRTKPMISSHGALLLCSGHSEHFTDEKAHDLFAPINGTVLFG
jgi:hypothetical protein